MKWLRRAVFLFFILWLVFFTVIWLVVSQLFMGNSRPFNQNSRYSQILIQPERFGVDISRFDCVNAQLQCIAISSHADKQPDKTYGKPVREQLHVRGLTLPSYGEQVGIMIMLHGKGSRKEEMIPAAMRYVASGFTVVLLDLPKHGDNTQDLQWAAGENDGNIAVSALVDFRKLTNRHDEPAFLWGISMGGVYANRTAKDYGKQFNGMIMLSSYDCLEYVLRNQVSSLPSFLQQLIVWHAKAISSFRGLNIEKSAPAEWAKKINLPILQIHGDSDRLIPIESGKRLFDDYKSIDKQWITVTGAGHNNTLITPQPIYAKTIEWLYHHRKRAD